MKLLIISSTFQLRAAVSELFGHLARGLFLALTEGTLRQHRLPPVCLPRARFYSLCVLCVAQAPKPRRARRSGDRIRDYGCRAFGLMGYSLSLVWYAAAQRAASHLDDVATRLVLCLLKDCVGLGYCTSRAVALLS